MGIKNIYRIILSVLLLYAGHTQGASGSRTIERVYISTDRSAYVAGEAMWVSLYCFDYSDETCTLSTLSSVAYIELHSDSGVVLTAKVALQLGRGSGKIDLPLTLPTGNYRMIAYTRQMQNEERFRYFEKIITVYNTLSTERLTGNVVFTADSAMPTAAVEDKKPFLPAMVLGFEDTVNLLERNRPYRLIVTNAAKEAVSCNLSVVRRDLEKTTVTALPSFLSRMEKEKPAVKFVNTCIPDYEGEVIKGKVHNLPEHTTQASVFLSTVGNDTEVYVAPVDSASGEICFYTGLIFGNREVALEYISETPLNNTRIELLDPFVKPPTGVIPQLYLDKSLATELVARSVEMQMNQRFNKNTSFTALPVPGDPLLSIDPVIYKLDNYTRFPDMKEVIIEFVSEVRFREVKDKNVLQVAIKDDAGFMFSKNACMVLVDGILLFDHNRILDYDPLKVASITIYQQNFRLGHDDFNGLVKFTTYNGDYPGLVLDKDVSIQDYQGLLYPCRFTGQEIAANRDLPDLRTLLYWDPLVDLKAEERKEVMIYTSTVPGRYAVIVEGVSTTGMPVYQQMEFTVK